MQTNTRDLGFVNFNGEEMNFINYNGVVVYEAWKKLIASGISPLTLLKCKQANLLNYKIYGNSVQNGTPTPDTPIEIESVGEKTKNLFDNVFDYGIINSSDGVAIKTSAGISIHTPNYTAIKPNTQYVMTNGIKNNFQKVRFYDKDKKYIGYSYKSGSWLANSTSLKRTATTPDNAYYFRVELDFDDVETSTAVINGEYPFMLEEGSTATDYEPYGYKIPVKVNGDSIFNIYLKEPLRKIGDYADYIDFENGKIIRYSKEKILKGEEDWSLYQATTSGSFKVPMTDSKLEYQSSVCSHYENVMYSWDQIYNDRVGIYSDHNSTKMKYFRAPNSSISTVDDFKSWLATQNTNGTPVTLNYLLATPIEEAIELPTIPTNKGTNIIEVDTTIQPSNMEVTYLGKK